MRLLDKAENPQADYIPQKAGRTTLHLSRQ